MTNRQAEERLHRGFDKAAPQALPDDVVEACVPRAQTATAEKAPLALWRPLVSTAAVFGLIVLGFALLRLPAAPTAAMSVSLDVNPSITLEIDENGAIVGVNALNEDGSVIVGDTEWKGHAVEIAVDSMVDAMVQNGYLNENANSVLISVDGADEAQATAWEQKLAAEVQTHLENSAFHGAVISQTVSPDEELKKQSEAYGISYGKAMLIQRLIEINPLKTFDDLAPLSINDLNLLCVADQMPKVNSSGNASDKAYIGEQAAIDAALAHAGITLEQTARLDAELDCEDGIMCYEIEYVCGESEYEYEIHAVSGEVLTFESETAESDDIDGDDDRETVPSQSTEGFVDRETVKATVLAHAQVTADSVFDYDAELETENGATVYEVEFSCGFVEYDYRVDAVTGEVLSSRQEDESQEGSASKSDDEDIDDEDIDDEDIDDDDIDDDDIDDDDIDDEDIDEEDIDEEDIDEEDIDDEEDD